MKTSSVTQESDPQSDLGYQRRRLLQTALAVTAGVSLSSLGVADAFAAENSGVASPHPSHSSSSRMNAFMQDAIKACIDCHSMCLRMAMGFCLEQGGRHVEHDHFRLMINCAEICQTSANFMLSNSPLHGSVCAVCAEACEACAKSCDQIGDMRECADECRRCAKSCRAMS